MMPEMPQRNGTAEQTERQRGSDDAGERQRVEHQRDDAGDAAEEEQRRASFMPQRKSSEEPDRAPER
jgi:hypothetical protein